MANVNTLTRWLEEAESALHSLEIGERVVRVSHGDRATEYTAADVGKLELYISRLQNKINRLTGARRRGPIKMVLNG